MVAVDTNILDRLIVCDDVNQKFSRKIASIEEDHSVRPHRGRDGVRQIGA